MIMGLVVIPTVLVATFIVGIDRIIDVVPLPGIVIGSGITIAATTLYFVLKHMHERADQDLEYFYTGVPQGMIVMTTYYIEGGHLKFYVKIVGYNRQNELRNQLHEVTPEQWREYKHGQYVSFDDNTST
jgi:hypothetical protein